MTFQECIKKYIKEDYTGKDNTCNGRCIKCGECCGIILPLDQDDADKIQDYVIKNNIHIQRTMLVMANKLQCPYYTGNKEKGCAIYEARPKICKYYKCDKNPKNVDFKELKSMKNTIPVDMWSFANAMENQITDSKRKQ